MYFMAKNRIPHSTTCKKLIELQVLNDELLKSILVKGRLMLSRFSARVLIEAINIWIKRKLMCSLQKSSYFFILADECQDISRFIHMWQMVNGKPESTSYGTSCPFCRCQCHMINGPPKICTWGPFLIAKSGPRGRKIDPGVHFSL